MGIDSPLWYAIHTKPKEEERANVNLTAWNVETFSPRIRERRYNQFGHSSILIKPFFPGYIFARFNAGKMLHKIYYTRGVHNIVSFGGQPIPIDNEVVALIQARVEESGFIRISEEMKPGDNVQIKNGLFAGLNGVFDRGVKDTERVKILLTTIKYQASIQIDSELVQKGI